MVKSLLRTLRQWTAVEGFVLRMAAQFRRWPGDDLGRFVSAPAGAGLGGGYAVMPPPIEPMRETPPLSPGPAACETRFMKLHLEGRFEEMWNMLAEDAQVAWGTVQDFVREMPRLDEWLEILDMEVAGVTILESWTDQLHDRTYNHVARLVMRYRVRQQWREWTFDRQVHLVPAAGGWRTLCYPTRARVAAGR